MAEYIERGAIIKHIEEKLDKLTDMPEMGARIAAMESAYNSTLNYIMQIPTVEVEPVKYGHWIFKKRVKLVPTRQTVVAEDRTALALKKHIMVEVPYCSICGEYGDCKEDATPYCPNCGAKMDGREAQE